MEIYRINLYKSFRKAKNSKKQKFQKDKYDVKKPLNEREEKNQRTLGG